MDHQVMDVFAAMLVTVIVITFSVGRVMISLLPFVVWMLDLPKYLHGNRNQSSHSSVPATSTGSN
jgi:hypothetical protein